MTRVILLLFIYLFVLGCSNTISEEKNGFTISGGLIPSSEIFSGGPNKDDIPAIDHPKFLTVDQAEYLHPNDRVLGIELNGVSKAYPIAILNWHEIVNDRISDEAVIITYCPLCGSGMAFEAALKGESIQFGVSGLLYKNDVLLFDRKTESLWSQILGKAVTGPLKGTRLTMLPLTHTTWQDWQQSHPETVVLSQDTGHLRDYRDNPYKAYANSQGVIFPTQR